MHFDGKNSAGGSPAKAGGLIRDQLLGTTLDGRFKIEELIGSGGMSNVYRATQLRVNRDVAIKTLKLHIDDQPAHRERFQHEVDLLCALSHPNIVTLYDWLLGPDGQPCVVMDYLRGSSLEQIIESEGPLSISRLARIFVQVLEALEHAHRKGVVHRDIKPGNIVMIDRETDFIKVVDFGLAKFNQGTEKLTNSSELWGSPPYMSPEQCMGKEGDKRSDIYSVGVVMYEMLTGKDPFHFASSVYELIQCHVNKPPPPLREANKLLTVPPEIEALLFKAMAKNPDDRYQTVTELKEVLVASCLKANDDSTYLATGNFRADFGQQLKSCITCGKPIQRQRRGSMTSWAQSDNSKASENTDVCNCINRQSDSRQTSGQLANQFSGQQATQPAEPKPAVDKAAGTTAMRQNADRIANKSFRSNQIINMLFALLVIAGIVFGIIQYLMSIR